VDLVPHGRDVSRVWNCFIMADRSYHEVKRAPRAWALNPERVDIGTCGWLSIPA